MNVKLIVFFVREISILEYTRLRILRMNVNNYVMRLKCEFEGTCA